MATIKQLKYEEDTYEIIPHKNSHWQTVTKNKNVLCHVVDEPAAFQVIYYETQSPMPLSDADFIKIKR